MPDCRALSARPARTVHEEIRERRLSAARASLANLIEITRAEIARIDAGRAPAMFATASRRSALVREIEDYTRMLGAIVAPGL